MSKSHMRELRWLLNAERNGGRLTPHDQQRKAELLEAMIGPAVQAAVQRIQPQIAASVDRVRAARAVRVQRQQQAPASTWAQRQAAAWSSLQRSQTQQRKR